MPSKIVTKQFSQKKNSDDEFEVNDSEESRHHIRQTNYKSNNIAYIQTQSSAKCFTAPDLIDSAQYSLNSKGSYKESFSNRQIPFPLAPRQLIFE